MADLGAAFALLVQLLHVVRARQRAIEIRAGQDVVRVRRVAAAVDDCALLGQRVLLAQFVGVAVQVGDARRDDARP